MKQSYLDWERSFLKFKKKKMEFSLGEAIFIKKLANIQPVRKKKILEQEIMKSGLSREEFFQIYEILKKKKVLQFTNHKPKGFHIINSAIRKVNRDYKKALKKVPMSKIKDYNMNKRKIDDFFDSKDKIEGLDQEFDFSQEEIRKILKEWEKKHL